MVQQGLIPGNSGATEAAEESEPMTGITYTAREATEEAKAADAAEAAEEAENVDAEVLKDLWIKPDGAELQCRMGRLNEAGIKGSERRLKTYSETYLSRKMKLLGHVVRTDDEASNFKEGMCRRTHCGKKKSGQTKAGLDKTGKDPGLEKVSLRNRPNAFRKPREEKKI